MTEKQVTEASQGPWGAQPINLRSVGATAQFRRAPAPQQPSAPPPQTQALGSSLRSLLTTRGSTQLRRASELAAEGFESGTKLVLIGSSSFGSGASTIASTLVVGAKTRAALLDPRAEIHPGAGRRLHVPVVSWDVDSRADLETPDDDVIVVGGTARWAPLAPREQYALIPRLAPSRRMLIIECLPGAAGLLEVLTLLPQTAPVTLLWVSRVDETHLHQSATDLRHISSHAPQWAIQRRSVLVTNHLYPRPDRRSSAAAAAAADQTSGRINVPFDQQLVSADRPIPSKFTPVGQLLAASVAVPK